MKKYLRNTLAGTMAFLITVSQLPAISAYADETENITSETVETPDSSQDFTVSISNETSPQGVLTMGSSFSVKGTVSSEKVISKAFGGIYTADGEQVIYYETEPNAKSFDIMNTFDTVMTFAELSAGDYIYKIEVVDSDENTVTATEKEFSIADNSTIAPEIAITGASEPADILPTECVFSVRGQVSSSFRIKKIWGGVYNEDGTQTDVFYEDTPDASSYNLNATFDNYLDFGSLPAGKYVYKIEATDIKDNTQTLIEKSFEISDDESVPSDIQLYNAQYPTGTLMQGKVMSIKGSIFSTHTIESVTGGIYKAEDSDCDYNDDFVFTIEGGRKSFNLNLIDNDIVFNQLPVGEYVYKVAVTDVNGYTKEVINSTFRIRSSEQSDELQQAVMKGIDVSELNGDIDWEKVYADGIDFAVIRAGMTYNGDANYHQDSNFEKNYEGAKNAGLKIGAYLYTSAINKSEMKSDIEGLIKTLEGKSLDMPVYIDFETNRQTSLNKQALTEIAAYGCQLLSENGYKAGVYTSYNWFRDYIDMAALNETDCEIWLAFWPNDVSTVNMSDFCVTWQYCSDGTVKGITGDVDGDYRYAALSLESYALNIVQPETGMIKTDKDKAFYGERVTVSAELDRTHRLKSGKYNGTEASYNGNGTFSFSMPENEVEITVEIEECDPSETATNFGTVSEMPVPFGTASTSAPYYSKPCDERLASIPEALMLLTPDGYSWEYDYVADKPAWSLTLMDYANIYSFIHNHDLDADEVRAILSDADKMVHRKAFTDEEIDILLSDDLEQAMKKFASKSTIVIGEKGYSTKWMYEHNTDDYIREGITPEMVTAVQMYYYNPLFVQSAADAFSQNLFNFTSLLTNVKCRQWLAGDVNLDGTVNAEDETLLEKYLSYEVSLSFVQWASADMNGDSTVDENDLSALKDKIENGTETKSVNLDVIEFCQYPDYPTGCESVSLYMLLNFYGTDVTIDQIYDLLPMGAQPYDDENGVRHGANPEREFVGDPRSDYSYGVFNDPIAVVAENFKKGVRTKRNASIDDIKAILDTGNPVLAWYVSAPMRPIMYRWSWIDELGETVDWPGGEHAVVICGYDDSTLTYRDPNAGTTVIIDYETFSKSFDELGGRIVFYTDDETVVPDAETVEIPDDKPEEPPVIDTSEYFATVEEMEEMTIKDFKKKTRNTAANAETKVTDDGSVSITLTNYKGDVLDTYTIDPKTGKGTQSNGDEVNLPQTGNNSMTDGLIGFGAFMMTVFGAVFLKMSGVFRRRKDEQ